jgi:hypothetical protein
VEKEDTMKTLATIACLFAISLPVHAQFTRQPTNVQQLQQFQLFANAARQAQLQNYLAQQQQILLYQQMQQQAIQLQQAAQFANVYPQYGALLPQQQLSYPLYYRGIYPQLYGSYYPFMGFGFPF